MKLIPPIIIDDTSFATSSITEPSTSESTNPNWRGLWNAATTYMVNAIVYVQTSHRKYVSLQNDNLNHIPADTDSETWWLDIGATDQWLPFDAVVGGQVKTVATITYEIELSVPINTVAILNVRAETIKVVFEDFGASLATISWTETVKSGDIYTPDVVKTDFPTTYLTPKVYIEISNASGATNFLGEIVVGNAESLGATRYSPTVGILDYSIKQVDTFGNYTVLERAYSKRLSCATWVLNSQLDSTFNLLAENRAQPVLWVGSELYASMIVYGFFKDFTIEIPYVKYSVCTLEIEGLV